MISIFDFDDYKAYLTALEQERSQVQRGFRSRLAEVLGCQNAYISQVLNTSANFSLEQGLKIAHFLALSEQGKRYFLLLLELNRAGTKELQQYFLNDLKNLREKNLNLKDRLTDQKYLTTENQNIYYSSWLYPTIHMLITIPKIRTTQSICEALSIDQSTAKEIIFFLITTGLATERNGEFHPGNTQLHLGKDSPQIRQHHTNWRVRAIQSLDKKFEDDIHYSTVSTLSKKDADKLKSQFTQIIQEYVETVRPSKEEVLYNFNLDFYSLIK